MLSQKPRSYILFLLSAAPYIYISYFLERFETTQLLSSYFFLFIIYAFILTKSDENEIDFWILGGVLFRASLLFFIPNLSDDIYRFIWDGRLIASGVHPFTQVPAHYIENNISIPGINEGLFSLLNSQERHTIYPPIAQFIFWVAVVFSPHSILGSTIIIKIFILGADIGSIIFIRKLLKKLNLPNKNVLIYALNPLIILEFTGNVHFEGIMICFFLVSVYLLLSEKLIASSIVYACAIATKLIPLMFLPALIPFLGLKRSFLFYIITGVGAIFFFSTMINEEIIKNFQTSLGYYFSYFEFNPSIYALVRAWGFWKYGYNIIQTVGWKLSTISFLLILIISFFTTRHNSSIKVLLTKFLLILTAYLLFSTTIHPWYMSPLIAISLFTSFRFPIVWSLLIFGTYAGYNQSNYIENATMVIIEYVIVFVFLIYEIVKARPLHLLKNA